ncbi:MAG TPA: DUF4082 domain-containing protein, partial [Acidimicrobiales bacterium]|nr:DUF4082 domain-containing protein [Acidimicrobiales bacterium]
MPSNLVSTSLDIRLTPGFGPATGGCPCSIWPASARPESIIVTGGPLELGVKFRSDVAGTVTGGRFYKGAGDAGTHVGNLWSASGTLLASATF